MQGSGIGPAAYVVYATDLKAVTPGNLLCKFTDDTYLIVPASNVDSQAAETGNIDTWAWKNNPTLNRNKSNEIVFFRVQTKASDRITIANGRYYPCHVY